MTPTPRPSCVPALRGRLLALLARQRSPLSTTDIVHTFGLDGPSETTVNKAMAGLVAEGKAERVLTGRLVSYRVKAETRENPGMPRAPVRGPLKGRVLDLLDAEKRPMTLHEIIKGLALFGSDVTLSLALKELVESGEVKRTKEGRNPAKFGTECETTEAI